MLADYVKCKKKHMAIHVNPSLNKQTTTNDLFFIF